MNRLQNHPWTRSCQLAALIISAALSPLTALGEFKGSDSLALNGGNWSPFTYAGDGVLLFRNSRLEFQVASPQAYNSALAVWRPNTGSYQKGWFIQVDVHLDKPVVPDNSFFDMGLSVESSSASSGSCYMMMKRTRAGGVDSNGFTMLDWTLTHDAMESAAKQATIRLHFDAVGKSLVGSVNDGSGWAYARPLGISTWGMAATDVFYASLIGQNGGSNNLGLANGSGSAYFKNFKAGAAVPDLSVQQPAGSGLKDGRSKTSFGTVSTRRNGRAKTYLIRNDGTAPLEDLKLVVDGPDSKDFVVSAPSSTLLMPGGWAKFKVTFRPKGVGTRKAALHVLSNDADMASFDVKLSGMGVK